ncbi:hypothetical protein [Paracoccus sp. KR1-242]|uniref:hypothetical protein n=1 Tax=Paracoccus sp. KR1-242 TaxID=3410028 RepID=UPI003C035D2E
MTKLVLDVERIKYERCKAMLFNLAAIGCISLGGAVLFLYNHGWTGDLLPVVYTVVGFALFGLRHYLKGRWREALRWRPDHEGR